MHHQQDTNVSQLEEMWTREQPKRDTHQAHKADREQIHSFWSETVWKLKHRVHVLVSASLPHRDMSGDDIHVNTPVWEETNMKWLLVGVLLPSVFQASDCGSLKWRFDNDTYPPGSETEADDQLIICDQIGRPHVLNDGETWGHLISCQLMFTLYLQCLISAG